MREYANPTAATPYRTTERRYYPQTAAGQRYVVDRAAEERLWQGDVGGSCRGQTRYIYDDASDAANPQNYLNYQTPPTRGQVREVWQAGQMGTACDADWVRAAYYEYDGWGNRGLARAANGTDTLTDYAGDPFHVHPLSATIQPSAGQGPTLTTTYRYYGINAEGGGRGLAGQQQSATDPNGAITRQSYDAFGRLTDVRRPGAGWSHPPTEQYAYIDSFPFTVRHRLRDDANGDASPAATYLENWTFHDGLGQVIQTQSEVASSAQSSIASTQYDVTGQVVKQNMPYLGGAPGTFVTPDWTQPTTQTTYDALGRVRKIIAPDGTETNHYYALDNDNTLGYTPTGLWAHAVADANKHARHEVQDAFGRTVKVREFTGTCYYNASNPGSCAYADRYVTYAETTYGYNVRDQLADVWDTAGHHTAIGYDLLGRKTGMSDPDMGAWSYGYDAAGNLKRQTDARNQTTCFYYDGLNRLKGKTFRSDINCPTADPGSYAVSYGYDSTAGGNPGLGRRTSMTTTGAEANSASWVYDVRGRVTNETRTIAGVAYSMGYGYDSADRVRTTTYPGGEIVTTGYNAQGLAASLVGAATYVSSAT